MLICVSPHAVIGRVRSETSQTFSRQFVKALPSFCVREPPGGRGMWYSVAIVTQPPKHAEEVYLGPQVV